MRQAREVLTSSVALGVIDSAHQAADFTADTATATPLHWLDPLHFIIGFAEAEGKRRVAARDKASRLTGRVTIFTREQRSSCS